MLKFNDVLRIYGQSGQHDKAVIAGDKKDRTITVEKLIDKFEEKFIKQQNEIRELKNKLKEYELGVKNISEQSKDWEELLKFIRGKTIEGIIASHSEELEGFDLVFTDGTSLELYVVNGSLAFVLDDWEGKRKDGEVAQKRD